MWFTSMLNTKICDFFFAKDGIHTKTNCIGNSFDRPVLLVLVIDDDADCHSFAIDEPCESLIACYDRTLLSMLLIEGIKSAFMISTSTTTTNSSSTPLHLQRLKRKGQWVGSHKPPEQTVMIKATNVSKHHHCGRRIESSR